jgi:hypothetical protein
MKSMVFIAICVSAAFINAVDGKLAATRPSYYFPQTTSQPKNKQFGLC